MPQPAERTTLSNIFPERLMTALISYQRTIATCFSVCRIITSGLGEYSLMVRSHRQLAPCDQELLFKADVAGIWHDVILASQGYQHIGRSSTHSEILSLSYT